MTEEQLRSALEVEQAIAIGMEQARTAGAQHSMHTHLEASRVTDARIIGLKMALASRGWTPRP